MTCRRIRAYYKQLSEFKRDRIIGLKAVGRTNRKIIRHMGRSDADIRRCWQEWVDSWNPTDWGRIAFSDEPRFQLCPDNHRRCVWRRLGQRADPAFTIACPTSSQPQVMVWRAILTAPSSVIRCTLTAQRYVDDILRALLLPLLLQYLGLIFSKIMPDYIRHVKR
ncbi:uncharacterized protein TNCV_1599921 [Trichonephila clavipes]|nr:uncharacterized protein TNCV_1599921 [Trichonephila clavipes]